MNRFKQPRALIGTLLIILGTVFILMNLGLIGHVPLSRFWPLILMMIGLSKLIQTDYGKARWDGAWLLLLGVWFQMVTLKLLGMTYRNSWPLLLIVWGVYLTGAALARRSQLTLAEENHHGT